MFEKLTKLINENNFSGVVYVEREGQVLFHEAYGFLERANKIENKKDTSFGVASGTKLFTGLGILKLIESDKLKLDSKVFDIIEKPFSSYNKDVTVEHLLTHTSGLADYFDEDLVEDFDNFKIDKPWHELLKPSDYYSSLPDRPMKFEPGSEFNYNNSGFVLLAMIIEKLTGDYHTYIDEVIVNPLQLKSTGFYKLNALPKNTAYGYIDEENGYRTNVYNLPIIGGGDGGIFTSANDLSKLWHALMEYKLLSPSMTDNLFKAHTPSEEDDYYGLAVWLDSDINPYIVGSDAGVSFVSRYIKDKDIIISILSNTSDGAWSISRELSKIIKNS